jgi:SMODS and SLOG-associating 2TM effector domain 1
VDGARAASETLKAEVYRYRAGVAPYDAAHRDRTLSAQLAAIQNKAAALALDLQQTRADDRVLPEVSDFPVICRAACPTAGRLAPSKIAGHVQAAKPIRFAELAATAVAALLGAIAAALDTEGLAIWIGVATTIGAAFAAHQSATQRDRIAAGYAATADRLDLLIERLQPIRTPPLEPSSSPTSRVPSQPTTSLGSGCWHQR